MFFCDECARARGWAARGFKSLGPCEICGQTRECNDVPSRLLPEVKLDTPTPSSEKWAAVDESAAAILDAAWEILQATPGSPTDAIVLNALKARAEALRARAEASRARA